jgi:uncharacterized membrane protein YkvA (DUF1232 family)
MRITLELEPADVDRFLCALKRLHRLAREAEETDVVAATKQALNTLPIGNAPSYVRKRIVAVQRLILMLEDEAWALPQPERGQVLETLAYFSDPEDLIPDDIEVIGLLDDAIVLEILLRQLRHVLHAYTDFRTYSESLAAPAGPAGRHAHARQLAARRDALRARMRRRRERECDLAAT